MAKITPNLAIDRLYAKLSPNGGMRRAKGKKSKIECVRTVGDEVFLLRDGDQGIIVPGNDDLDLYLGTTDSDLTNEVSPALNDWLQSYQFEIQQYNDYIESNGGNTPRRAPINNVDQLITEIKVNNLIPCNFGQVSPYYRQCKFKRVSDNQIKTCYTGCVPTSIVQLMYYWWTKGYLFGCWESESYNSVKDNYTLIIPEGPAIPIFDFASIKQGLNSSKRITSKSPTNSINAIAQMMYGVGRNIKAKYGIYELDGTGVDLKDYFYQLGNQFNLGNLDKNSDLHLKIYNYYKETGVYDNSTIDYYVTKGKSNVTNTLITAAKTDLDAGRPVLLSGENEARTVRHCFLCQGYREIKSTNNDIIKTEFQFNFGDGSSNNWFQMTATSDEGINNGTWAYRKLLITGIQPTTTIRDLNGDGKISTYEVLETYKSCTGQSSQYNTNILDLDGDGKVTPKDVALVAKYARTTNNYGGDYLKGDVNLDGVVDISDVLTAVDIRNYVVRNIEDKSKAETIEMQEKIYKELQHKVEEGNASDQEKHIYYHWYLADVDDDGVVSQDDIYRIANLILGKGDTPEPLPQIVEDK